MDETTLEMTLRPLGGMPSGVASLVGFPRQRLSPALQSLAARRLLAMLLREHAGMDSLPPIAVDENGKPWFPDHPSVFFNLSHCDDAVMAVVAPSEVGCDIERVVSMVDEELTDVCLSETQKQQLLLSPDTCLAFTRIWTRKEAAIKRSGLIPDDVRQWPCSAPRVITLPLPRHMLSIAY